MKTGLFAIGLAEWRYMVSKTHSSYIGALLSQAIAVLPEAHTHTIVHFYVVPVALEGNT